MASVRPRDEQRGAPLATDMPNNGRDALAAAADWDRDLRRRLYDQLMSRIDLDRAKQIKEEQVRLELYRQADELCREDPDLQDVVERAAVIEQVIDEIFGYGPIAGLMRDPEISDILINGPRQVFIEKRGLLRTTEVTFRDENHLSQIIGRLLAPTGRRLEGNVRMLDARMPDGSRLNVVVKPPALNGPVVSIRRFGARPLTIEDLLAHESLTKEMIEFLAACVHSRMNIIISGGTGSGKTTLLNALSRNIPFSERVVTIEDTAELELQQPHVVKMEAVQADGKEGSGVTIRDLVKNSLRMRPDRIIVGECRGPEALEMLQAMNTGHEGSLTTIHANSPRDALTRIELMIGMAGIDIPLWALRKQIASAIHLIVQVSRLPGGKRKIVKISEITGLEGDTLSMHDVFEFVQTSVDPKKGAVGWFQATGIRPKCLGKLSVSGANVPVEFFAERRLGLLNGREAGR
jgi:pilus assembly protein CpaF